MTDYPTDTVDLQKRKEANLFKAASQKKNVFYSLLNLMLCWTFYMFTGR